MYGMMRRFVHGCLVPSAPDARRRLLGNKLNRGDGLCRNATGLRTKFPGRHCLGSSSPLVRSGGQEC